MSKYRVLWNTILDSKFFRLVVKNISILMFDRYDLMSENGVSRISYGPVLAKLSGLSTGMRFLALDSVCLCL